MPYAALRRFLARKPRRVASLPFSRIAAVDGLERRVMLSGGSTCVIDATDGRSITIDVNSSDGPIETIFVTGTADIGSLTINGSTGNLDINIDDGATLSSLKVNGGSGNVNARIGSNVTIDSASLNGGEGNNTFVIDSGTTTGSVTFSGGGGVDRLFVEGTIGSTLSIQTGGGNDRVEVLDSGQVVGDITGNFGDGDDLLFVNGPAAAVGNVGVNLGDGRNLFTMDGGATANGNVAITGGAQQDFIRVNGGAGEAVIDGNVSFTLGEGDNRVVFSGVSTVNGNMEVTTLSGEDRLAFERVTLNGNQTINLGSSTGPRDAVAFGNDDINGSSTVTSQGQLLVEETGARDVQSDYTIEQTQAGFRAFILMDQGSTIGGNLSVNTQGQTDLIGRFVVRMGNATINTGQGADYILLRGDTRIEGNANFTLGSGSQIDDDVLSLNDGRVEVIGNMTIQTGGGTDEAVFAELFLDGNQTIELGSSRDGQENVAVFGNDDINGSSTVTSAGGLYVFESATRDIQSDYIIRQNQPAQRALIYLDQGSTIGGNLTVTTQSATDLIGRFVVRMGNATINTGQGADYVLLRGGTRIEGNANLTLGSSDQIDDDILNLNDGRVEVIGNMSVQTGSGTDEVVFAELFLNGNQTLDVGASRDGEQGYVRFGQDEILGSSTVNWIGAARIEESGSRSLRSDYVLTGTTNMSSSEPQLSVIQLTGSSQTNGNLRITTTGRVDLRTNTVVLQGNATVNTGRGNDAIDLSGLSVQNGNNLNVSTAAGNDSVTLTGVEVTGNVSVNLASDDDTLDNSGLTVGGTASFDGGSGFDTISNPNAGNASNFEA